MSIASHKQSLKKLVRGLLVVAVSASASAQSQNITIASFGGNLQKDLSRTLWQPAAQRANVALREESHDGSLAQLRVQVQSGRPGWDVVHLGSDDCAVGAAEGLFAPLDYTLIAKDAVPNSLWRSPYWIAQNTYSVVLAWRTDKYKSRPPRNWRDFWNVKEFPGRRALSALPQETMEIALLADGVPKDKLYPLDTKRSFASLERIKKNTAVWYTTGAQSAQLIKDGEVDMIAIYGSRVVNVINDGAPVNFTYEDGLLGSGCLAVVKGSTHVKDAQRFVAGVVSAEVQARIPSMMSYYGPVNPKAYELAAVAPDVMAKSNMSPENRERQVAIQDIWWRDHVKEVREAFKNLITN